MDFPSYVLKIKTPNPISSEEISTFEAQIQHNLSADYRFFLENFKGARLLNTVAKTDQGNTVIQKLYDFESLHDVLHGMYEGFTIEKYHMLPFCNDAFGNLFCLYLNGENFGKIYFYNHETEDFYYTNNSFTDFLKNLMNEAESLKKYIEENPDFAQRIADLRKNSRFK